MRYKLGNIALQMAQHPSPAKNPRITASDRLGFTLFLALTLHALVVLGVGFTRSSAPDSNALPSLEIILANSRSLEPVENPDFLAQVDQAGGGESEEKARPSAPVSANTPLDQHGLADQAREALQKNQLAINKLYFISQQESQHQISQQQQERKQQQKSKSSDKAQQRHRQIAKLQAEIRQMTQAYARRPKVITLTASTKKAVEASYLATWVQKIERTGNLNYPAEARAKQVEGHLRMSVRLNASGNIVDVNITRSSGSSLLDEAARRILRQAEPFASFPQEMQERADQIVIIRTWDFNSNRFRTDSGAG
ncbi:MAG: energy transducer TonB [Gammaproteobacteria bacterium]|nr:energy transducer TonB [Gammaproteobacteria bacterium]